MKNKKLIIIVAFIVFILMLKVAPKHVAEAAAYVTKHYARKA